MKNVTKYAEPANDNNENEINTTFLMFFLAIIYSVVLILSCIR